MTLFLRTMSSVCRGQKRSFLQLASQASWSKHLPAQTSFQLAPPPPQILWWAELISHFFCKLNPSKYFNCPSGKLRTESTSPKPKSTSPGLLDTSFLSHTFFACWYVVQSVNIRVKMMGRMLSYQGKKWKIVQTVIQKSAGGLLQGVEDNKSF